jgi:hypothetical protein
MSRPIHNTCKSALVIEIPFQMGSQLFWLMKTLRDLSLMDRLNGGLVNCFRNCMLELPCPSAPRQTGIHPQYPKAKVIRRKSNNCITFSGSFSFDGRQITVFADHSWNATVKSLWHCFMLTIYSGRHTGKADRGPLCLSMQLLLVRACALQGWPASDTSYLAL